ncbi:MAG: TIGR02757 family protein, partial [Actinobacteria bacterium RBG_13_35_12]
IAEYGSLNNCFLQGLKEEDKTVLSAALNFAKNLNDLAKNRCSSLVPSPIGGSAFKRLNLYLRWMVRRDNVDPGGWIGVSSSKLIIPLDTHMYRISLKLGFTERKQADIRTAMEITSALKKFDRDDPVKYDFALTRLGMNKVEEVFLKKYI